MNETKVTRIADEKEKVRAKIMAMLTAQLDEGALVAIATINPKSATLHEFHILSNIHENAMIVDLFNCAATIVEEAGTPVYTDARGEGFVCDA